MVSVKWLVHLKLYFCSLDLGTSSYVWSFINLIIIPSKDKVVSVPMHNVEVIYIGVQEDNYTLCTSRIIQDMLFVSVAKNVIVRS